MNSTNLLNLWNTMIYFLFIETFKRITFLFKQKHISIHKKPCYRLDFKKPQYMDSYILGKIIRNVQYRNINGSNQIYYKIQSSFKQFNNYKLNISVHFFTLKMNLSTLKISKYFFVDAVTALKRQKQIKLVTKLKTNLLPTYLLVKDTTMGTHSCGPMYKIVIQSPAFLQKTKLQQHKMVMDAISDDMEEIHAVNLKTRTPSQINILNINMGIGSQKPSEKLDQ